LVNINQTITVHRAYPARLEQARLILARRQWKTVNVSIRQLRYNYFLFGQGTEFRNQEKKLTLLG
jgi:hypothetical protein